MNAALTTSLIGVFIDAAAGKSNDGPNGFVLDGKGTWTAGTRMDVDLHLGADTSFGKQAPSSSTRPRSRRRSVRQRSMRAFT